MHFKEGINVQYSVEGRKDIKICLRMHLQWTLFMFISETCEHV